MKTYALMLGASALAISCCATAFAADSPTPKKETAELETVVVTGQRRTENLQTTGVAATVLTATDIENKNVVKIDDLQFTAPAVVINNFGQGINFNIRGVGKGETNTQTLTGVITYRDGVATFPGYFTEEPYYDIAGVEVYRGPQGTFVGQNATGGAVFVRTNDPEINGGYNGYVLGQAGNYSNAHVQGAVNIPVSDTFAARVSFFAFRRSSYFSITDSDPNDNCPGHKYADCKPGYNPGDAQWAAGRISLLWKPSDALTVSFKYDADYLDNGAYPSGNYTDTWKTWPTKGGVPMPAEWAANGGTNPHYSDDIFHITANGPQYALDRFTRAVLKVDYVFPDGITLRSVSGFQNGNTNWSADLDATDYGSYTSGSAYARPKNWEFFDHVDETIWSQEINLISPDTWRINWVLGLFGQSDIYDFPQGKFFTLIPANNQVSVPGVDHTTQSTLWGQNYQSSYAVFGQIGYHIIPSVEIQFGGRYSINRTTNNVTWNQYGNISSQSGRNGNFEKSDNFSYKGSLNWTIDDNNFAYAFVATGYKPGGLNPPIFYQTYQPNPFGPETITSYETGWKSTMLDGHLRGSIDAYYNEYDGFIVTVGYPNFSYPGFATEVNNPSTTTSYGFETELEAVFGNFRGTAGVGLMHQSLGKFYAVDARAVGSFIGGTCDPAKGPGKDQYGLTMPSTVCVNLAGHAMTYAPLFTFNIGVEYAFHLESGDTLTPRLNFGHQSPQWASLFANEGFGDRIEARNLLGGQFEWKHDTYVMSLFGTNLLDQHYTAAVIRPLRMPGPPREYGLRVTKVF
jgi:iron complex outermembrane recepter protein